MPNIEEHCQRTMKRYGVEGRDIHSWLDEPSKEYAAGHRQFRHDTETVRLVGEIFGKTYGKSLAENIALDHIMFDHENEIKRDANIIVNLPDEKEIPTIPCVYCSTLLRPSDQFCPNCGASRTKIIEEFDRTNEKEKLRLEEEKKHLHRELKRELALEQALGELTPEERAEKVIRLTPDYMSFPDYRSLIQFAARAIATLKGYSQYPLEGMNKKSALELEGLLRSSTPHIARENRSQEKSELLRKRLEKLGWYDGKLESSNHAILDKLVQEDFERDPELKEQVDRETERVKSVLKKIGEVKAEYEAHQAQKSKFSFNPFKRRT